MTTKNLLLWLGISLLLIITSFLGFEEKNDPMESTSGIVESYSFGRGGDFSLLLKTQDNRYKSFDFAQFRTSLLGKISERNGKTIRIEHYGNLIANCWEDGQQFCYSKCTDDRQCRLAQNASSAGWLRSGALLIAFGISIIFAKKYLKRKS